MGSGSKVTWCYNWGQTGSGSSVEFVPMLWGTNPDHVSTWNQNAKNAIAAGSSHLLSFNEPDFPSQANIAPAAAAAAHIQYMNPFASEARIGAPAITSDTSTAGRSLEWLKPFLTACAGQCALDFFPVHWYGPADPSLLLAFVESVHDVVQAPVWVTEWQATTGSASDINSFVQSVTQSFESDPTYSYIERHAYFMVDTGGQNLLSDSTTPTQWGQTFAFS
jgi:hypothetical protein